MADNTQLSAGTADGVKIAGALTAFSGVSALHQVVSPGLLSGSEGAWTYTLLVGGAGAVAAGVQRVTLASDDPAVAMLGTINGKITACNTGAVVVSGALPAGDNNIGNVDIVTLPAGNLGMQAMAASLSVVPASNITDATYIGDIKFGEALPAGTNAIGKLAANSGVDIGDVDVTSIAAGTNTIGGTISQQSSSVLYDGSTACTIKEFMVVGTTNGNNTIVDAVAAKKIRLLHLEIIALSATANTVYLVNDDYALIATAANPIPVAVDADADNHGGFVTGPGWRRTTDTVNEAVVAVQSSTAPILYMGTYIEVA